MSFEPPKVIQREVILEKGIALKRYLFDSVSEERAEGWDTFFQEALDKNYDSFFRVGTIGVCFGYVYGASPIYGLDVTIYRSSESVWERKKFIEETDVTALNRNAMIHTLTFEKRGERNITSLHRHLDGTRCLVEDIISGSEAKLLYGLLKQGESIRVGDFVQTWPELEESMLKRD